MNSFLYDMESVEYKYYLHRVAQEEAVLASEVGAFQTSNSGLDSLRIMHYAVIKHVQVVVSYVLMLEDEIIIHLSSILELSSR